MVHGVILVSKAQTYGWCDQIQHVLPSLKLRFWGPLRRFSPTSLKERSKVSLCASISWKGELLVLGEGVFGVPYLHLPLATPEWSNLSIDCSPLHGTRWQSDLRHGKMSRFSPQIHRKGVFNKKNLLPRKLTWNLKKSPLGKGEENKTSSKPSLFGEFYLNFRDRKFKVDVKGLLTTTQPKPPQRKGSGMCTRDAKYRTGGAQGNLMPTRSIDRCSQKMWRCVVVAMYFDVFFFRN